PGAAEDGQAAVDGHGPALVEGDGEAVVAALAEQVDLLDPAEERVQPAEAQPAGPQGHLVGQGAAQRAQGVVAAAAVEAAGDLAAGPQDEGVGAGAALEVPDVGEAAGQQRGDGAAVDPGHGEGPAGVVGADGVAAAAVDPARQPPAGPEHEGVV